MEFQRVDRTGKKLQKHSSLLQRNLPPVIQNEEPINNNYTYGVEPPSQNLDNLLPFLPVPSRQMLARIGEAFGQAWFDGKESLRLPLHSDVVYPFWILTFWSRMLDAIDAKARWMSAEHWLHQTGQTTEEAQLKIQIRAMWSVTSWQEDLRYFASMRSRTLQDYVQTISWTGRIIEPCSPCYLYEQGLMRRNLDRGDNIRGIIRRLPPVIDGCRRPKYLARFGSWSQAGGQRKLYNVLYREPKHWTVAFVDFEEDGCRGRSTSLKAWAVGLGSTMIGNSQSRMNLVGATQTDGCSCGIILWRMKAFCDILQHALAMKIHRHPDNLDLTDTAQNLLAVHPDINDDLLNHQVSSTTDLDVGMEAHSSSTAGDCGALPPHEAGRETKAARGTKRRADTEVVEEREKKVAKTATDPTPAVPRHPIFSPGSFPTPSSSKPRNNDTTSSFVGISRAATKAREMKEKVKNGTFKASATKTVNFQNTCRSLDADCTFEPTCSRVQCSTCEQWKPMKEPYNTTRFKEHIQKGCEPPLPKPKVNTLNNFFTKSVGASKPRPLHPRPQKVSLPCPGLTARYDEQVGIYLSLTYSNGGGARSVEHYSEQLFEKSYMSLSKTAKQQIKAAQIHDHAWRNDTSKEIMATFSGKCLKTVDGLEELLAEDNRKSPERRWLDHFLSGRFTDDKVFKGLFEARMMALDREVKGLGKQNFKYSEDLDTFYTLLHIISPRAYREFAKVLPARSERSVKHKKSTSPRFPLGITAQTYQFVVKYCEDYGYPTGAPLSLAVDDTKLDAALRPLYDGVKQKWFIVGAVDGPIEVADVEELHATLEQLAKKPPQLATKIRLWTLQIPIPRVPPLVLAIMPLEPKVKGVQLAEWQIALMKGLILHGFRITASGGDGASVERDCQRRLAAASKRREFRIKHPDSSYPDIVVELWEMDGNVFVVFQDAKHGRKTFNNNIASGARGLVLGNHLVHYGQLHALVLEPDSPLYKRDWINRDRMDDNAAARITSADTLRQAAQNPSKNLGLVAYLFVFGDLTGAYQSRTMSHHERAKIAIRTRLFIQTWHQYLAKGGYSEARHFISKEAYDISQILINGILGLIVIHRDHLGDKTCPLLPWMVASEPNEHSFSDFTLQEAMCIVPTLRTTMQSATTHYPSDSDLSSAYLVAIEENNCLWSLLGIHPNEIEQQSEATQDILATAAEQLQAVIDSLKDVPDISRAGDSELDACVMARDLPTSNPERFAEIQKEISEAMNTRPTAFIALLEGIANKALAHEAQPPPPSKALLDISSSDLSPLVQLRRDHQTREERMGVRTYTGSDTYKNHKTGEEKPLTERQLLAQRMHSIIRRDQERSSSTGLNRTVRWTGATNKTGNAANGGACSKRTGSRRYQTPASCFQQSQLEAEMWGFVMVGAEIYLARVITMYSKNGGKAGSHSWVTVTDSIGSLSYLVVQLYQHSYRRQFKITNRNYTTLGTLHFSHLPSNSFLALLPQGSSSERVVEYRDHVEIGQAEQRIYEELDAETPFLAKAVAALNTVRRKGKADVNLVDVEEDDEEE
ncbi:hypothetical protein R3P38DRAFT_3322441 [Favolaschia claudopus]|uniref:Uncharacterized protein n=1 Tax=Favolaschia claudopus TaxID=2862362 RepID=A0AAW0ALC7_9AGAR